MTPPGGGPGKEGSIHISPAGMSSLKNVGKSEVTIYTVVLKPE